MKTSAETWTVREILNEVKNGVLTPNPEYQRGQVWTTRQRQMLIDSLMRGFHLPLFYFHEIDVEGRRGISYRYEIIDGQQRVNSIVGFRYGDFALLDPTDPRSRFPLHLRSDKPEWAGMSYDILPEQLRNRFLDSQVSVAEITESDIQDARDLFVRLQGHTDLTSQERRDALPGELSETVARIGGKPGVARGNRVFQELMGLTPHTDRGRTRQLVAQLIAIAVSYEQGHKIEDVNKPRLDDLYYDYLELGSIAPVIRRLEGYLAEINDRMVGLPALKLPNHVMMHLVILWLQSDGRFASGWKDQIRPQIVQFMAELRKSQIKYRDKGVANEFYAQYSLRARSNADRGETIRHRHAFFMDWLQRNIEFVPIDPRRSFDWIEREYVYLKFDGICAYAKDEEFCGDVAPIPFSEVAVHHVVPHSAGGRTELSNAVLTHAACNQKLGASGRLPPCWAE